MSAGQPAALPGSRAQERAARCSAALAALRAGRPVLVSDDADREDEADLILAASTASAAAVGFVIRHSSGVLCAPMPAAWADRLALPHMVESNQDPKGTAYAVSCDAVGVGTGIGAGERATTLRALADPGTPATALTRPGHVFPLRAHPQGLAGRRGHTEAGVALSEAAGLGPVAVIAELVGDDGEVLRGADVAHFALEHGLVHLWMDDLRPEQPAAQPGWTDAARLPTAHGDLLVSVREDLTVGRAEAAGDAAGGSAEGDVVIIESPAGLRSRPEEAPLVRLHSECLTSEGFGSLRCDCAEQLQEGLASAAAGQCLVLYLRGHEGRGIGLANKVRAYALQDEGADTVQANVRLGRLADERGYALAAAVLKERGLLRIRLLSNNPAKALALRSLGIEVVGMEATVRVEREEAREYLQQKRRLMGHLDAPSTAGVQA